MAYIDYLRKFNDKPSIGMGGSWWDSFVNSWKNTFNPPKVSSAVNEVQKYVNKNPSIKLNTQSIPAMGKTTQQFVSQYPQQKTSTTLSKPQTSFSSPVQNSGASFSLPKSSSPANLISKYKAPTFDRDSAMSPFVEDLKNLASGNLGKTVGGIFGTVGQAGTTFAKYNPISGPLFRAIEGSIGRNPFEMFVSEAQAQEPKEYLSTMGSANETSLNQNKTTTNPLNKGNVESQNTRADVLGSADEASNYSKTVQGLSDTLYGMVMDPTVEAANEQAWSDMYSFLEAGGDADQAYQNYAETVKQNILGQYGRVRGQAEAQLPEIQKQVDELVASEVEQMQRYDATMAQKRASTDVGYDEALHRQVGNQKQAEGQLRNVFTNLGTAESSAFIDRLSSLTQEALRDQSGISSQKAAALKDIDTQGLNERADSGKRIKSYQDQGVTAKKEIEQYIRDLSGEETEKINEVMANLYNSLTSNVGKVAELKGQQATAKANQLQNVQNMLAEYAIGNQQQKDYAALQGVQGNDIVIGQKVRPRGVPSDMWSRASELYTAGLRGASLKNGLKQSGGVGWDAWYDTIANMLAQ